MALLCKTLAMGYGRSDGQDSWLVTEYDASDMQESFDDDFETKSLNSHFPLAKSYLSYFSRMQPQSRDLGKWVGPQGSANKNRVSWVQGGNETCQQLCTSFPWSCKLGAGNST